MKKKLVIVLLTTALTISSLTSCGERSELENAVRTSTADVTTKPNKESGNSTTTNNSGTSGTTASSESVAEAIIGDYYEEDCDVCYEEAAEVPLADYASSAYAQESNYCMAPTSPYTEFNTEEYSSIKENSFQQTSFSPLSTFSADVDTASYSNLRRMIRYGYRAEDIPSGAIRIEEMLNYFHYDYKGPNPGEPFGVNATISTCPWNPDHDLMMLGLQTETIDFAQAPASNIVFLIDVSGSMEDDNKLPLLVRSFSMLLDNLTEKDRVSIVTYAGSDRVVLKGVPASEKELINKALQDLEAGGGTNGSQGIATAYELAENYFIQGGNNRVILATDGDFNIGAQSQSELYDLIREKKESNIFLSVLGFGMGNYSDTNMETLADAGNGNYAYIDSLSEAKKVLVTELGATMVTVAKDVKLQVEFNPAMVSEYRLIGYENRMLNTEDFEDDTKDAGEIGAGHSVTVLYEIVRTGKTESKQKQLKYQDTILSGDADSNELLTLSIRYKEPDGDTSKLLTYPISANHYTNNPSSDFVFASAVAELGMVLRKSEYVGNADLWSVDTLFRQVTDPDDLQMELILMMTSLVYNNNAKDRYIYDNYVYDDYAYNNCYYENWYDYTDCYDD